MDNILRQSIIAAAALLAMAGQAHTGPERHSRRIHYTGRELSNPMRHDGALTPVVGAHNIQTLRACREKPDAASGYGWTYNHQPMMAHYAGRFYIHYLQDPESEHVPPSRTLMQCSTDGYRWSRPVVLFPEYPVPEGFAKQGQAQKAHNLKAIMHQRVGFYLTKDGSTLLATGNYGIALHPKDDPNDGNGIGRVVRRIMPDGRLGDIYFIYYNHDFNPGNTIFPHYSKAPKAVREACRELLSRPRQLMQWAEEADRGDTIVPLGKAYKAYCDYTLPDGSIACLWKHALTSVSRDGGRTWAGPVERAEGFVNSNAKIWGQRLADGSYATVYNPSEYRWPLAMSLSADGLEYTTLNLVCGEVPPMRYGGNYKSYGPQYVRGIQEGNGTPPDGHLWLTYSMNKEDIWVARVPVPVQTKATAHAQSRFAEVRALAELTDWNIYSPAMARVEVGGGRLTMHDSNPFDYARIERKIPETRRLTAEFAITPRQNSHGTLQVEFLDRHGTPCSRITFTPEGSITLKGGARYKELARYEPGQTCRFRVCISVEDRLAEVWIDGKKRGQRMLLAPVEAVERVMMRTGTERTQPGIDTPADRHTTLPGAGLADPEAVFSLSYLTTQSADADAGAAVLKAAEFRHYADRFAAMEQEDTLSIPSGQCRQMITNAGAWRWMEKNIPLFDCPDHKMVETYYFRWWSLRKHLRQTPAGTAMTEFLVERSYADKYNLISSALGHHIRECRWIASPEYLDGIINTWYRGNDGRPMDKLKAFSQWTADALWQRYLVSGRHGHIADMLPELASEYDYWNATHRLPSGLFWQADVQDAMEESISGGRKRQYARPSINSYMFGNAQAIARMARVAGRDSLARLFASRADSIRKMVESRLWNPEHNFFETLRGDTSAAVREAIGFLPWYFGLPSNGMPFGRAWLQAADKRGFAAPCGLTTAEQRHPEFRTRGTGRCEWDGAVWPFATSQTLTAMANYLNDYPDCTITDSVFFAEMKKYAACHTFRGLPYIGEYLDPQTGYWLMGDRKRSRYYNHSTFADLVITGICGLRPQEPAKTDTCRIPPLTVNPLVPQGAWDWFCIDNIAYHGHRICIVWDRHGSRYHIGRGLTVLVDGRAVANRKDLGTLKTAQP